MWKWIKNLSLFSYWNLDKFYLKTRSCRLTGRKSSATTVPVETVVCMEISEVKSDLFLQCMFLNSGSCGKLCSIRMLRNRIGLSPSNPRSFLFWFYCCFTTLNVCNSMHLRNNNNKKSAIIGLATGNIREGDRFGSINTTSGHRSVAAVKDKCDLGLYLSEYTREMEKS